MFCIFSVESKDKTCLSNSSSVNSFLDFFFGDRGGGSVQEQKLGRSVVIMVPARRNPLASTKDHM